jgi:Mycothiol maleylpyruvate isomerase N-terminal domain
MTSPMNAAGGPANMRPPGRGGGIAFESVVRRLALAPLGRIDTRELFPAERRALLDLLAELTDDEWHLPTVCTGWTVHDLVLHLLGVDVQNLSGGRDRFNGPPSQAPAGDLSD